MDAKRGGATAVEQEQTGALAIVPAHRDDRTQPLVDEARPAVPAFGLFIAAIAQGAYFALNGHRRTVFVVRLAADHEIDLPTDPGGKTLLHGFGIVEGDYPARGFLAH